MKLAVRGISQHVLRRIVARVATTPATDPSGRVELVYAAPSIQDDELASLDGYRALLTSDPHPSKRLLAHGIPIIHSTAIDHLKSGDVVVLASDGTVRTVYRPDSGSNFLFATDRCNSNCLMCSQPPKDIDDSFRVEENLEVIRLMTPAPTYLGITGGEPTLLGEGLFRQIEALRDNLPNTRVHMLTNGRRFAWHQFTDRFVEISHPAISLGIPLYADNASHHDYVVQAPGAFDQTILGLYSLARYNQDIEIRVVLHALTIGRLRELSEFLYRNLPFVNHVALMGLEITGYTPHNIKMLWIDPAAYQAELEDATGFLHSRGMNVSIYNHQLCVLKPTLWSFARKSISDWKNIYLEECAVCSLRNRCGGLFKSAETRHSEHIKPFLMTSGVSESGPIGTSAGG